MVTKYPIGMSSIGIKQEGKGFYIVVMDGPYTQQIAVKKNELKDLYYLLKHRYEK